MKLILVAAFSVFLIGCPPPHETARDSIAGALGLITTAQAQWRTTCPANPTMAKCAAVTRLIDAQHAAAAALLIYCGGPTTGGALPYKDGGACVPVNNAGSALKSAVENLNSIVELVKSFLTREAS